MGRGEYSRALAIARGAATRWPGAAIHFILSREAPYAGQAPFPATWLASSPTFHSAAVIKLIETWAPDVVIFDNAGRTAQLQAVKRSGAGLVYVSARPRQRRKAFRLRWMGLIDEHWIAYPEFVAGRLSFLERLLLKLLRRPTLRYLDVMMESGGAAAESILAREGLVAGGYVLVVPGGGTGHPGAAGAVDQFLGAARGLAALGMHIVFVGREQGECTASSLLRMRGALPQSELAALMRNARLIVANGGSTLLQSIACGKPCVAAPIARDQHERIRRCAKAGVAVAAPLHAPAILRAVTALLDDAARFEGLAARSIALGLSDGVDVAVRALNAMLLTKRS